MTYDRSYIAEKLRGLIGFKRSYDASNTEAEIDEELSESSSGVYVNELHSLFTPENFNSSVQQFSQFTVQNWGATASYLKGKVIRYLGNIYLALRDNTAAQPDAADEDWMKTTFLSMWFRDKYDSCVLDVVDMVFEEKKLSGHGKQLRGETSLFSRDGYVKDLIPKSGRFVGFEVSLKHPNTRVQIQRIGLQLDAAQTVPIHIIYMGEDQVVSIQYSSTYKRFQTIDVSVPAFLFYEGSAIIGYYEDDLTAANAINQDTTIFNEDYCTTCGGSDAGSRSNWTKYVDIHPVQIVDDEIEVVSDTNFGMNLVMSFYCDLSDIIIRQRDVLIPALKARLRVAFLEELGNSTRANTLADAVANLAFNESKDWPDPYNAKKVLDRSIKALSFELSGLNEMCLSCEKKTRIKTYAI